MATLDSISTLLQTQFAELTKEMNAIRKDMKKIRQHIEDPNGEKRAARSVNNGFNKPQKVTDALRSFLNLGADEMISRSQVTRKVNEYVEAKGLKAGQNITLDASLKDLLKVPEGVQVTFLNIQKYINPHYIKEEKPATEKKPRAKKATETAPAAAPATAAVTTSSDVAPPKEKKMRPKVAKAAETATA